MKVALTTRGPGLDSPMDDRFGRAPYFITVETETWEVESEENVNVAAGSGAGIGSAEFLSRKGVEAVITGNVGPKASGALAAAGIVVYALGGETARDNLEAFQEGRLSRVDGPSVDQKSGLRGPDGPGFGRRGGAGGGRRRS